MTSSATTLAIDTGSEREPDDSLAEATHLHAQAAARRRAAETSRGRWLPGRRRELAQLHRAEALTARRLEELRRQGAERSHGKRPFTTGREPEDRLAQMRAQRAERRLQRELDRGRDTPRSLDLGR